MKISGVRKAIIQVIDDGTTGWEISGDSFYAPRSKAIVIGHPAEVGDQVTMAHITATFAVSIVVNPADSKVSLDQLYDLIDPREPGSIQALLYAARQTVLGLAGVHSITASNVGPREFGPTGWLVVDVLIPVNF